MLLKRITTSVHMKEVQEIHEDGAYKAVKGPKCDEQEMDPWEWVISETMAVDTQWSGASFEQNKLAAYTERYWKTRNSIISRQSHSYTHKVLWVNWRQFLN